MFKELWTLIKLLFNSNPKNIEKVELLGMNNFPFKGYKYMMWCGKMIYRNGMIEKRKKNGVQLNLKLLKYMKLYILIKLREVEVGLNTIGNTLRNG